jgi:hypothetical protein
MDNELYYVILGGTYLFALVVRQRLKAIYTKYARVSNRAGLSGAEVARGILDANGLRDVQLELARGKLTDHYDPRTRVIRLSLDNARSASVAAMGSAPAGALQDEDGCRSRSVRRFTHWCKPGHDGESPLRFWARCWVALRCFFWECSATSGRSSFTSSPFPSSSMPAGARWSS